MRVSGKETLSARNKAETTSKRVFRQEVERLAVCNASHSTWNNGRKNKAHIAIYPPAPPPVLGSSGLCTRQASAQHSDTPALHPSASPAPQTHPADVSRPCYFWPTPMFHKDQEGFQQPTDLFRVLTAVCFRHFVVQLQEGFLPIKNFEREKELLQNPKPFAHAITDAHRQLAFSHSCICGHHWTVAASVCWALCLRSLEVFTQHPHSDLDTGNVSPTLAYENTEQQARYATSPGHTCGAVPRCKQETCQFSPPPCSTAPQVSHWK